ncbi:MAG: hypothetical protein HN875_06110 [Candidatus Nitrosopelagicus sp.]|jgi:uncharacterized protein YkwD|nr:hypothetical protein [Candidatus Nitrosopelagicus sp.]
MGCSHNYVYTQGYFSCTKCGKRSYGKSYKKKQGKKVVVGVIIAIVLGVVVLGYSNGIFEINQEKLEEAIQNIPQSLPSITENIPSMPLQVSESIEKIVDTSVNEINKIEEKIQEASMPEESSEEYAIKSIEYINQKRAENGKKSITHDSRVYELAMARAKDMHEYQYHDHTNPITGTCPYNMKSEFGLRSNENVAENAYLFGTETNPTLSNPSYTEIIDGWMDSTGHRMNLLSYEHVGGSVACYGGFCVFLGLNHGLYGEGCYTASEGQAYASRFDNCTPNQMRQYEQLLQDYDKIPSVTNSQAEYQKAMSMYNQIENFRC